MNSGRQPQLQPLFHHLFTLSPRSSPYPFLALSPQHTDMMASVLKGKKILYDLTLSLTRFVFSPFIHGSVFLTPLYYSPLAPLWPGLIHTTVLKLLQISPSDLMGSGPISLLIYPGSISRKLFLLLLLCFCDMVLLFPSSCPFQVSLTGLSSSFSLANVDSVSAPSLPPVCM